MEQREAKRSVEKKGIYTGYIYQVCDKFLIFFTDVGPRTWVIRVVSINGIPNHLLKIVDATTSGSRVE